MEGKETSKAKTQATGKAGAAEQPVLRFPTEQLLSSKALSGFQPDFARAVLTEPEYTLEDALNVLNKFFKGGGK